MVRRDGWLTLCTVLVLGLSAGCGEDAGNTSSVGNQGHASASNGIQNVVGNSNSTQNGTSGTSPTQSLQPLLHTDWPLFGNNDWQDRCAPNLSLTPETAKTLQVAFDTVLPGAIGGNETYPVEQEGVLYATTEQAHVIAMSATTGKILWTYIPSRRYTRYIPQVNRGVALYQDKVYVLTPDDQLVALDKHTGSVVFDVSVADPSVGYFESMAPIVEDGVVVVGSAGGDEGVRGFVAGFQADTGTQLWKFYTVPTRGQGWMSATGFHGGGAVWTTPAYEPASGQVLFGTGNPSPDYFGETRPGPDPYTDSVVSVNIQTGKLNWYQQEVPHDLWDYDVASPPMVFPVGDRLVVGEAGKDGYWYEWDAKTGAPVTTPVPFVKEDHKTPTASGTLEWPGPGGGANYGPSAYSPQTRDAYIAGINGPETVYAGPTDHQGHDLDFGTGQNPAPPDKWTGTITAVATSTGKIEWQIATPTPPIGGVTVTLGGAVLFGLADGTLEAVDASTGDVTWKVNVGAPIGTAPIVYTENGKTYLAISTGGANSLANLFPYHGQDSIRVYQLP